MAKCQKLSMPALNYYIGLTLQYMLEKRITGWKIFLESKLTYDMSISIVDILDVLAMQVQRLSSTRYKVWLGPDECTMNACTARMSFDIASLCFIHFHNSSLFAFTISKKAACVLPDTCFRQPGVWFRHLCKIHFSFESIVSFSWIYLRGT